MGSVPVLKPREVVSRLLRLGFVQVRQRGSHKQFRRFSDGRATTVPFHLGKDIPPQLLRDIVEDAGVSMDEFLRA